MVHSVDRSFCESRCNELGVCFSAHGKFVCYCDNGGSGGSCGVEPTTLDAEAAPLYTVEVLLRIALGLCAAAMLVMVVLFLAKKYRKERRRIGKDKKS
ncbi:unnamed protein product [Heligmosomoides polygyrus]|uniref:EGF-like domain-containing protein n=1 Tax=Heligmosomoides polygyrus TaxID=6339 RepID=A0A183GD45_HELPZ|nr:unnamed protein product [Heligmosomoides polygyrus]